MALTDSREKGASARALARWLFVLLIAPLGVSGVPLLFSACGEPEVEFTRPTRRPFTFTEEDYSAPRFHGIKGLAEVSPGQYRVTWQAANDNVTAQDNIRYVVVSTSEGYRPDPARHVVIEAAPGATEVLFRGVLPPWPLHVIAIDEAGNESDLGPGLRLPSRARLMSLDSGLPLEPLFQCVFVDHGEAVCSTEQGSVMQFKRDRWIDHGSQSHGPLRLSADGRAAWLWSEDGYVLRYEDEQLSQAELSIMGGDMDGTLPLRSLTREPGGLWIWRNSGDQTWWGVPPQLRYVESPALTTVDFACNRPPLLSWNSRSGVALCEDGGVLQQSSTASSLLWEPLTVSPEVSDPAPVIESVDSMGDFGAILTRDALLLPAAGPWRRLLAQDEGHELRGVFAASDDLLIVAATSGLWAVERGSARLLRAGSFAGVGPAPTLRAQWQWLAIDSDASLHPGHGARLFDLIPQGSTALAASGWDSQGHPVLMGADGRFYKVESAELVATGARWRGLAPASIAIAGDQAVVVGGSGGPWAHRARGSSWDELSFMVLPEPEDGVFSFEPLLERDADEFVSPSRAGLDAQPLRGVHAREGAMVAWGQSQLWLGHPSGAFAFAQEFSSEILSAAALGGNGYLVWTAEGLRRCSDISCEPLQDDDRHGADAWRRAWLSGHAVCGVSEGPGAVACAPLAGGGSELALRETPADAAQVGDLGGEAGAIDSQGRFYSVGSLGEHEFSAHIPGVLSFLDSDQGRLFMATERGLVRREALPSVRVED